MSAPTTKVDIRLRIVHLDRELEQRRATRMQQQDERRALMDSCHTHGGHVPVARHDGSNAATGNGGYDFGRGFFYACEFCGGQLSISREQQSRRLLQG